MPTLTGISPLTTLSAAFNTVLPYLHRVVTILQHSFYEWGGGAFAHSIIHSRRGMLIRWRVDMRKVGDRPPSPPIYMSLFACTCSFFVICLCPFSCTRSHSNSCALPLLRPVAVYLLTTIVPSICTVLASARLSART